MDLHVFETADGIHNIGDVVAGLAMAFPDMTHLCTKRQDAGILRV